MCSCSARHTHEPGEQAPLRLVPHQQQRQSVGVQWYFGLHQKWSDKRKFEAGAKVITREDFDGFNRTNINIADSSETYLTASENGPHGEDIFAVYNNYGFKTGPWGFQLGLRAEQANITATQITQDSTFYNNYFRSTQVFITYEIARGKELNLSYSRRVQRPGVSAQPIY